MPHTGSTTILTLLHDVSDFAKEIGFPYRTLIDPVLIDVLHSVYGNGESDTDPLRHLVIPLRMMARLDADATRVRFSIRPFFRDRECDRIPIVATFQSDRQGDYFAIMLDDSRLKPTTNNRLREDESS
jgi:hypothetical protein